MIIVQVKEGENIERALKKFKRKYEKTGIVKELRSRQGRWFRRCRGIQFLSWKESGCIGRWWLYNYG